MMKGLIYTMAKNNKKDYAKSKQGKKSNANYKKREQGTKNKGDYNGGYLEGAPSYNDYVGKENDPRWYTQNQRLISDVTKIPFNAQIGFPIEFGDTTFITPSICRMDLMLGPGVARSNADGVNIAGQALFQKMRKDLSTYAPYAQADVTMFVLAMTDLFVRYSYIARIFGVANLYSYVNLNYSDSLLRSMNLSEAAIYDLRQNFNDYRSKFNTIIYKMQSLYMPAAFPIIERYLWLFSNYFIDHDDPRAQIYVFNPYNFWTVDETSSEEGTALNMDVNYEEVYDVDTHLDNLNRAVEAIRTSDSMLKIMADMRNAFKDVAPWKFSFIDETYCIYPTYSTEVLSQIENAVIAPTDINGGNQITQSVDNNIVIWEPYYVIDSSDYPAISQSDTWARITRNTLLNMHWTNPTSDDIVVATRLTPSYRSTEDAKVYIDGCGSDVIAKCYICSFNAVSGEYEYEQLPYVYAVKPEWATLDVNEGYISQDLFTKYLAFDWAPRTIMIEYGTSAEGRLIFDVNSIKPVVEIDNYTSVSSTLLTRIHNNVIMSMWNVPELGISYQ